MNRNIKLMDEIEKNMEVGENFYSLAMKIPFNEVFKLLIEGYSFNEAFQKQEDLLNVICAEQDYLSLGDKDKNIDIYTMFKRLEISLTKKIYHYIRDDISFELLDLHLHIDLNKKLDLDLKLIENFKILNKLMSKNPHNWLMKCLAFKQHRNIIKKEDNLINQEIVSKINDSFIDLRINN